MAVSWNAELPALCMTIMNNEYDAIWIASSLKHILRPPRPASHV